MSKTEDDIRTEERQIYLVVLGAMVPVVIGTLLTRGVFDAGATVCLGMLVLAIAGLLATALVSRRRRSALPRVTTRKGGNA